MAGIRRKQPTDQGTIVTSAPSGDSGVPARPSADEKATVRRPRKKATVTPRRTADPVWPCFGAWDWSEKFQDYKVVDSTGAIVMEGKFEENLQSLEKFEASLRTKCTDPGDGELPPMLCETDKGVAVAFLRQRGFTIYPVNPLKVAEYRRSINVSGSKSDRADALTMANMLRERIDILRPMPDISDECVAMFRLGRSHQNAVWQVQRTVLEMRSLLIQYHKPFLSLWDATTMVKPEARVVLAAAPTPALAARLTKKKIERLLRKAGRSRYIARDVDWIYDAFQVPAPRQDPQTEEAFGHNIQTLLFRLDAAIQAEQYAQALIVQSVQQHEFYDILAPIKGLGDVTAGRLLGELGDDLYRFDNLDNVRAFVGTSPVTKQSGGGRSVKRRRIKNNRAAHAAFMWAFSMRKSSPGAKDHYQRRRDAGDKDAAALRHLANRLVGCFWHCITTGEVWDEAKAWPGYTPAENSTPDAPTDGADEEVVDAEDAALIAALDAAAVLDEIDVSEELPATAPTEEALYDQGAA